MPKFKKPPTTFSLASSAWRRDTGEDDPTQQRAPTASRKLGSKPKQLIDPVGECERTLAGSLSIGAYPLRSRHCSLPAVVAATDHRRCSAHPPAQVPLAR